MISRVRHWTRSFKEHSRTADRIPYFRHAIRVWGARDRGRHTTCSKALRRKRLPASFSTESPTNRSQDLLLSLLLVAAVVLFSFSAAGNDGDGPVFVKTLRKKKKTVNDLDINNNTPDHNVRALSSVLYLRARSACEKGIDIARTARGRERITS